MKHFLGAGTTIPIKIEGMTRNVLIDKQGSYFEDYRLVKLLTAPPTEQLVSQMKDQRISWQKEAFGRGGKARRKK